MYGLVNRAIEQMVCNGHGEQVWEAIKETAEVDDDIFVSSEGYDDAITYKLVGAASEVLGVPPGQILLDFGRHWILRTAKEGYGDLLASAGSDLGAFLRNLPNFHTRVKLIYPHLRPPEFHCDDIRPQSLRLHYSSHRGGLAMFVHGLLLGLGEHFGVQVEVTQVASKESGADHDIFFVSWT